VREDVIGRKLDDHFIVEPIQRGAGTSINMNVNEVMSMRGPKAPE
jgi:aspartate ammonia-lyase